MGTKDRNSESACLRITEIRTGQQNYRSACRTHRHSVDAKGGIPLNKGLHNLLWAYASLESRGLLGSAEEKALLGARARQPIDVAVPKKTVAAAKLRTEDRTEDAQLPMLLGGTVAE